MPSQIGPFFVAKMPPSACPLASRRTRMRQADGAYFCRENLELLLDVVNMSSGSLGRNIGVTLTLLKSQRHAA